MKFLFFGDIVGRPGREALKKIMPDLKNKYNPDLITANGENSAHGIGISENSIGEMLEAGIDFVTSGNHIFNPGSAKESISILENKKWPIIRPANWSSRAVGDGYRVVVIRTKKVLIVNLIGRLFMHKHHDDPFGCIDNILNEYALMGTRKDAEAVDAILVDWHAEATSEKKAMGWFLDGRVSAVLGTHTHVPTADSRILPQGTAHISDIGMTGVRDSVLGINKDISINGFITQMPQKLELAEGDIEVNFVFLEIDDKTGLAKTFEKKQEIVVE